MPVIQADLTLEETYTPPAAGQVAAFPIIAVVGTVRGRDQEKSMIAEEAAELWLASTSAPASRLLNVPTDWYVLQEEAGVKAVLAEITALMGALQ